MGRQGEGPDLGLSLVTEGKLSEYFLSENMLILYSQLVNINFHIQNFLFQNIGDTDQLTNTMPMISQVRIPLYANFIPIHPSVCKLFPFS